MSSFSGLVQLESTFIGTLLVVNSSNTPVNADALPTFRVYGPDGFVKDGTTSYRDTGSLTNATNASPVVVTSSNHGLTTGAYVTIAGVTGNTAANGTFLVTKVDNNTYSLDGTSGSGAYSAGGTWNVTGLYRYSIPAAGVDGYETGESYDVQFTYAVSAITESQLHSFQVN